MKKYVWVIFLCLILLLYPLSHTGFFRKAYEVVEVIDGDTFKLSSGEIVRLRGIDAPEKGEYFYKEAKERLKKMVEGRSILLNKKPKKDRYGRWIAYVFIDNTFVNLEMVKNGFASMIFISPKDELYEEFKKTQDYAYEKRLGIWKKSKFGGCIQIENFHYNARGRDNENLNDEYVVLKNVCNFTIDLKDWKLRDGWGKKFIFPFYELSPNSTLVIYSGEGNSTLNEFYWNSDYPIWNNDGDTLYLRDREGKIVLVYSYS